ncbi:23S rRNA (guanosine(2251)-2'-O)-methyltransferase RlmB [Pedobacter yulinensis]|uniref:23S rRNA (Guanosine(2251)-2'-O)-methyltransferase RlmB n=1 Tax=Pedobacter yulinensis TaxID=2126353 RepID=A0A2T3HKM8_9SPHI|nr:23S rRNA (guanosine(2251)-2'-O)-methyltransferase RlmB [Pedobacter yulinensis]PST82997.1 23S rRNA (guanosine(2251)-2'-O)-methyltransferase RlmB [Pedobacter yulinensis]
MDNNRRAPRPKQNNTFIFGIRAVIEAVRAGQDIETIYVQRGIAGNLILELKTVLADHTIPMQTVPVEKLNRMTQKNHQGVIAVSSPITYQQIEDLIPAIYERGETPLVLLLDGLTDVRNMGAIVRTAACAGVHAIVVPLKNSAQINADAIKTSAGALFNVPVCRHASLYKTAQFLQESGLQLVACTEKTDDLIYVPDFSLPTAIIMGAEDVGISNELLRLSDHLAKIPMAGSIESLNVSVSAGVILYEAVRQRL